MGLREGVALGEHSLQPSHFDKGGLRGGFVSKNEILSEETPFGKNVFPRTPSRKLLQGFAELN